MKVKSNGVREMQTSERRVGMNINGRRQTMGWIKCTPLSYHESIQ
jgi:hypothetical protein